ncbi:MAG: DegT/DnrJ/EryC1/StrS family aminotransferase, partial [bacterium]|nr:DegT/DnrJ/EryC1/StrS family aminotransferase [bacterium]
MKILLRIQARYLYMVSKFKKKLSDLPYLESLLNYVESGIIPFQCPGHKAGKAYKKEFRDILKKNLFKIETNEIPIIDTFQNPQKSLKLSQELMAKAYGVYKTYYIVGGSTISNHIAIISSVSDNDKVLVPRNSHKSVFSAIMLSGAKPIFLYPKYNYDFNIDCNVSFDEIKSVVDNQSVSAVVVCHPNYYGLETDVKKIADYLDDRGILFIVDQAWGA